MKSITNFDVVLVPFPFADLSTVKKRPCLILTTFFPRSLGAHAVVAMITSNLNSPRFPFDIEISDLKTSGLPKASLIRLSKIVTLELSLVDKRLGALGKKDTEITKEEFNKMFKELTNAD